jgi:hypothetical protein
MQISTDLDCHNMEKHITLWQYNGLVCQVQCIRSSLSKKKQNIRTTQPYKLQKK